MAGSGFGIYKQAENATGILIPDTIYVDGSNSTWDGSLHATFVAIPNKYHKCAYGGPGGSFQIGILFPPVENNKGKWFAIEDFYGKGVKILGNPAFVPYQTIGGAGATFRTKAYFHCNGENWIQSHINPVPATDLSAVSDNLFKLIPQTIVASGTGVGWDSPSDAAVWEAIPNKLNICHYGYAGNTPIRIVFPDITENQGKWLGIQKASGTDVILPIEGLSGNVVPLLTSSDGVRPTVYYHCTELGWQMVSALKASPMQDISGKEDVSNKELVALDNSLNKYPSNQVAKTYIDTQFNALIAICNAIKAGYFSIANNFSEITNKTLAHQNLGVEGLEKKNVANGYAGLDGNALIPSALLPSYVDDVLEFATVASFPSVGEVGKIYVVTTGVDINKTYRWSGTTYVLLVSSPGSTDAVPEGTLNKYWTNARTIASSLTGFVSVAYAAITSSDTILSAFGKIQSKLSALASVATSGDYNDLINKPTIGTGTSIKFDSTIPKNLATLSQASVGMSWIVSFIPKTDMAITQIGFLLTNANASERVDVAIYDSSLAIKLATAFATFSTTGDKFIALGTTVNILAGTQYYLVLKGDLYGANNYAYTSCLNSPFIAKSLFIGAGGFTGSLVAANTSTTMPYIAVK